MSLFEKLVKKEEKLPLIGLGNVGMPIVAAFAEKGINIIGFDFKDSGLSYWRL